MNRHHIHECSEVFGGYGSELLGRIVENASRLSRGRRKPDAVAQLEKILNSPGILKRLIDELEEREQHTLSVLCQCPGLIWRLDQACRLLIACGVDSPSRSLNILANQGFIGFVRLRGDEPILRFEYPRDTPPESMPGVTALYPLVEHLKPSSVDLFDPLEGKTCSKFLGVDGWDIPIRLARFWQLSWNLPLKRTQQGRLYKRDLDRIESDPILNSSLLDAPVGISKFHYFLFSIGWQNNWLCRGD